ncbi:TIGR02679 family protein [Streptomyces mayteni]
MALDLPRLTRLLGAPELSWLLVAARRRMANDTPLSGTVSLTDPTEAQRAAAERLLGRAPRSGKTLTLSLDAVDAVLRRAEISPGGLAEAVVTLTGPVPSHAETARREADHWQAAFAPLTTLVGRRPELSSWLDGLHATGLARRLATTPEEATPLLATLTAVLSQLPTPATERATFAARVCGAAHALDDGRPLATLTFGAIQALTGTPPGDGAEWRRQVWASAGLLRDELSSTVLTLGLPGDPTTPTGRALAALHEAGQPAVLTLRQLTLTPPSPLTGVIHVCENPTVLSAAADRLGPACPPLVCLQGQPGTAALTLLRALAAGGARLHYHGDFDWGGLRIANILLRHVPWHPWRYTATAYRSATTTPHPTPRRLTGTVTTATWDPDLAPAMSAAGVVVEEELVLADLLADLAGGPAPQPPSIR